jgi:hypothetical protein
MADITKLPKWAQTLLQQRERRIVELERRLAERPPSNTFVDHFDDRPEYLDADEHVTFLLDDWTADRRWDRNIRVAIKRDYTGSYVEVMGGDTLAVEPQSSNVVKLRLARDPRKER